MRMRWLRQAKECWRPKLLRPRTAANKRALILKSRESHFSWNESFNWTVSVTSAELSPSARCSSLSWTSCLFQRSHCLLEGSARPARGRAGELEPARAYRWCCGRLRVHHSSLPAALDRGSFGRRTLAGRRLDPIPGRTPGGTAGG
jgi:hypothetical protein